MGIIAARSLYTNFIFIVLRRYKMGLFDKKYCDICGEKIGLLGNRKLENGNLCKNCAKKLSPWFDERRHSTVEQIKSQLAYREANERAVEGFHITRTFGEDDLICLDEDQRKFLVACTSDIHTENPDVLDLSQVTGCELDVQENRYEEKREDDNGNQVSYNPPRYRYEYEFYVVIRVNHPWFDDMRVKLNRRTVEVFPPASRGGFFDMSTESPGKRSYEYKQYEDMGREIKDALMAVRQQARDYAAAQTAAPQPQAAAAQATVTCPWCGAATVPDASGRCGFCGGGVNG